MNNRKFLAAALVLLIPVAAQAKHVPLPAEAYSAKTIYIDNQTGVQQTTDLVAEDVAKWGRLQAVGKKEDADLIASFTKISELDKGTTVLRVRLSVVFRGTDQSFYQDEEVAKGFHLENNRLGLSAHKCFDNFRKRLEEKH